MPKTTIAVAGIGYVGLANAVLLAQKHMVRALDVDPERVRQLNARLCPLRDPEIETYLRDRDLRATTDPVEAFVRASSGGIGAGTTGF